ncbi:MAG: carboxypeptidase regulatory-like domain-containing protein [Gemmatimonadota bacterium]
MRALASLLLIAAPFTPLLAQATIAGRVLSDSTRRAVPGAEIVMEGKDGRRTETDAEGKFVLEGIPTGVHYTMIRKIGFRPVRLKALIFGADTLNIDVRLFPSAVELEPIEVTAAAVPAGMEEFARRRLAGLGSFIDASTLRQSESRQLGDVLRTVRGVRIVQSGSFKSVAVSTRAGRSCPMALWVDGLQLYAPGRRGGPIPDLNDYPVSQLESIEIYSTSETPPEFGGFGTGCGTMVLWTRRR